MQYEKKNAARLSCTDRVPTRRLYIIYRAKSIGWRLQSGLIRKKLVLYGPAKPPVRLECPDRPVRPALGRYMYWSGPLGPLLFLTSRTPQIFFSSGGVVKDRMSWYLGPISTNPAISEIFPATVMTAEMRPTGRRAYRDFKLAAGFTSTTQSQVVGD